MNERAPSGTVIRGLPLLAAALMALPTIALPQDLDDFELPDPGEGFELPDRLEGFELRQGFDPLQPPRELDDFEQRGLRTNRLTFLPSLTAGFGYNDNVLAAPDDSVTTDVEGDFITTIAPELRIETNTQRHELFLDLGAESGRYFDLDGQNYDDFSIRTGGRLDISRRMRLAADVQYINDHETADDPDRSIEQLAGATEINRYRANISLTRDWQRSFVRLRTSFRRSEFDDVGSDVFATPAELDALTASDRINVNEGRDVSTFPTSLRLGYEAGRTYDLFTDLSFTATRYDRNRIDVTRWSSDPLLAADCAVVLSPGGPSEVDGVLTRPTTREDCLRVQDADEGGRDRDFNTWRALFGTDVDIDRLVTGEFSVGLEYRDFADEGSDDDIGFSFAGDLDFTLTPRTILGVGGGQGVRPTAEGATVATDVSAELTHALSLNTRVGATLGYFRDDRQEEDRTDDTVTAGLFAAYDFNRYLSVGANYTYRQRFSTSDAREFEQNAFFITLRGQY